MSTQRARPAQRRAVEPEEADELVDRGGRAAADEDDDVVGARRGSGGG